MNSRLFFIGLAAASLIGVSANAQTCTTCTESAAPAPCAACGAAQVSEPCCVCTTRPADLFSGLRRLAASRICLPCAEPVCAPCAAAEPVCAPCAAAEPVCAPCIAAEPVTICLPVPGARLACGVRNMVSGLAGALAEAAANPPCIPCASCVCVETLCVPCASCAAANPCGTAAPAAESAPSCTAAPVSTDLPESPEVAK